MATHQLDSLREDLTPQDAYEQYLCYLPWKGLTQGLLSGHQKLNGQALCEHPLMRDYGNSLPPSVVCQRCRELWSFRVNADSWREKNYFKSSPLTDLRDRECCNCKSCRKVQLQWAIGK